MPTDQDLQTDHGWDNRRIILASLAPRTTARPARRTTADGTDHAPEGRTPKKPGLLTKGLKASGRAARAGGRQFNKKVPPNRRAHTAVITAAVLAVLLVALAGVNYFTTDVNPRPSTTAPMATPQPSLAKAPLRRDTILKGVTAADLCPRDANYSEANRAFDDDFSTAWSCTRVKNQDGQAIQVDFGRQVTLNQIRFTSGFDATAPDGTDLWSKHRIVTQFEVYFPKDLRRDPITIDTGGTRNWRVITGGLNPPATVSKLLIRIKETSDPPQPATPTSESASSTPDDVTTVAISEIQFIGTDGHHAA